MLAKHIFTLELALGEFCLESEFNLPQVLTGEISRGWDRGMKKWREEEEEERGGVHVFRWQE